MCPPLRCAIRRQRGRRGCLGGRHCTIASPDEFNDTFRAQLKTHKELLRRALAHHSTIRLKD
jgi:hypothetical protein